MCRIGRVFPSCGNRRENEADSNETYFFEVR